MTPVESLGLFITLLQAAVHFTEQAQKVSLLIKKAELEQRALSDAEWAELLADDDLARAIQVAQLAKRA